MPILGKSSQYEMAAGRYHIILDLRDVPEAPLGDKEGLTNFLNKLPGVIGMKILNGPNVMEGVPENPGLTGFVIIDFSHISAHTFTNTKEVLVDIFSCKPYDQQVAKQITLDYFQIDESKSRIKEVYWG